jgi:hypothetical protein
MITTGDIESILYEDLQVFNISVFKKGVIPEGKVVRERIVIIPDGLKEGIYWKKGFVEINFCVPNISVENVLMANKGRLTELERLANKSLDVVSSYDGTTYRYSVYQTGQENDADLECYYVNVKLLFEVLNTK